LVIKFSHILTHLPSITIVFSYYNFNYGLRLSRYIGSRHFSPEEQKPIYRPMALKGLSMFYYICKYKLYLLFNISRVGRVFYCAAADPLSLLIWIMSLKVGTTVCVFSGFVYLFTTVMALNY
jgi:hypothetical protein